MGGARARALPIAAPLALLCVTALASPEAAEKHVILVQESNGFPGGEQTTQLSRQNVAILGDRLRVLDLEHGWALYVLLDGRVVQEADARAREYVERSFDYYLKYRDDRGKNLAEQAREFQVLRERFEDEPQKLRPLIDQYRRGGGDPDQPGRIVAKLQHYPHDKTQTTLLVDREERQVTLEHYVIRENQADRPIFDMWVTRDIDLPVDVLRYYREIGTFSPEVSAKLQEIEGTIVRCVAVLDTGSLRREFRSRVLEIRLEERPRGEFGVPEGFTPVDPNAKQPAEAETVRVQCALDGCDQEIDIKDALSFREPWGAGRLHYVCSPEHRRQLIRQLAQQRRKKD